MAFARAYYFQAAFSVSALYFFVRTLISLNVSLSVGIKAEMPGKSCMEQKKIPFFPLHSE